MTIRSRDLNIEGNISGTATFSVTATGGLDIGASTGAPMHISLAEVAFIQDGFSIIDFNGTNNNLNVNDAITWNDFVRFRAELGTVNINTIQNTQSNNLTLSASSGINIGANIIGSGNLVIDTNGLNPASLGVGSTANCGSSCDVMITDMELSRIVDGWSNITFGATSTTALDIRTSTWRDPVTFQSNTAISVNGALDTAAGSNGRFTFNAPTTINATIDASNSAVGLGTITLGNFAHSLGADLISNGNIAINGATTVTGAGRTINAGAYQFSNNAAGTIDVNGQALEIISNTINLGGTINGAGNLTLRPSTVGRSMSLAGSAGDWVLNADSIGNIGAGLTEVVIGNAAGNHDMRFGTATWAAPTRFMSGTGDMVLEGTMASTVAAGDAFTFVTEGDVTRQAAGGFNMAGIGRWLIYANSPANVDLDGLTSDFRRYNCAFGGACSAISATGMGLLYQSQPTLVIRADNYSRIYGDANNLAALGYTVDLNSLEDGDTLASIGLAGTATFDLAPGVSQFANVGTYLDAVTITGGFSNTGGYDFAFVAGNASITQRDITLDIANASRQYGDANPAITAGDLIFGNLAANWTGLGDFDVFSATWTLGQFANAGSTQNAVVNFADNNYETFNLGYIM